LYFQQLHYFRHVKDTKNEDHEYEEARETRLNDEEIALDDCDGRCFSCDDFDGNGCGRRIEDDEV